MSGITLKEEKLSILNGAQNALPGQQLQIFICGFFEHAYAPQVCRV
jgi:hypothetical protein